MRTARLDCFSCCLLFGFGGFWCWFGLVWPWLWLSSLVSVLVRFFGLVQVALPGRLWVVWPSVGLNLCFSGFATLAHG